MTLASDSNCGYGWNLILQASCNLAFAWAELLGIWHRVMFRERAVTLLYAVM
jgi:hypothetical protein